MGQCGTIGPWHILARQVRIIDEIWIDDVSINGRPVLRDYLQIVVSGIGDIIDYLDVENGLVERAILVDHLDIEGVEDAAIRPLQRVRQAVVLQLIGVGDGPTDDLGAGAKHWRKAGDGQEAKRGGDGGCPREGVARDHGDASDDDRAEPVGRGEAEGSGLRQLTRIWIRSICEMLLEDGLLGTVTVEPVDLDAVVRAEYRDRKARALLYEPVSHLIAEHLAQRLTFAKTLDGSVRARILGLGVEPVGVCSVLVEGEDAELAKEGPRLDHLELSADIAEVGKCARRRTGMTDRFEDVADGETVILLDPVGVLLGPQPAAQLIERDVPHHDAHTPDTQWTTTRAVRTERFIERTSGGAA